MIPLTVRSHYSLMWGTASIRRLCRAAKDLGYTRLALTDTDNLYGLWPFLSGCRREGITPIVGAEVTDPARNLRAVCLVENNRGYSNLCRLLTRRHMEKGFQLKTAVADLGDGLTVLTTHAGLLTAWHTAGVRVAAAMPRRPLPAGHRLCRAAKRMDVPLVATPGRLLDFLSSWARQTGGKRPETLSFTAAFSEASPAGWEPGRSWDGRPTGI